MSPSPAPLLPLKALIAAMALFAVAACGGGERAQLDQTRADAGARDGEATYEEETVLEAASAAFGEGAEGIAKGVERVFADLGRPNGYIVGTEAGGGFIGALRYGSGTLHHKIEGTREVHWTGPSIGLEIGGDAAKVFALVYNLYDTEELYRRYPSIEGQAYFVAGAGINYHQRGDVIVAPVRVGVGYRFTANVGYIKYTKERTVNPF